MRWLILLLLLIPVVDADVSVFVEWDHSHIGSLGSGIDRLVVDDIDVIRNNPHVIWYHEIRPVHAMLQDSVPLIRADLGWDAPYNVTGRGQSVCVIDSGIYYTSDVVAQKCFCSSYLCCNGSAEGNLAVDENGHGTHVAGIISSEDGSAHGVAPGAKIVSVKVLNEDGLGKEDDVISAVDWCTDHSEEYNISVITMSLGFDCRFSNGTWTGWCYNRTCDDDNFLMTEAVERAIEKNITVLAAAGNSEEDSHITAPSCIGDVISVGASTKSDMVASYSNIATILDILAPGTLINSTVPPLSVCTGQPDMGKCDDSGFNELNGTSMATPHVAGVIALIYEMAERISGSIIPSKVRSALMESDVIITSPRLAGHNFTRLDAIDSLDSLYAILDKDPPMVNFTYPTPLSGNVTNEVNIYVNISVIDDKNDISDCWIEWGTINLTMNKSGSGKNISCYRVWSVQGTGLFDYRACANDSNGNVNCTLSRNITINNTAPMLLFYHPVMGIYELDNISMNISFDDSNMQELDIYWYFSDELVRHSTYVGNGTDSCTIQTNYSSAGNHTIKVIVTDGGLNTTSTWNLSILDLNRPPDSVGIINNQWWYINLNLTGDIKNNATIDLKDYFSDPDEENMTYLCNGTNISSVVDDSIALLYSGYNISGFYNVTCFAFDYQDMSAEISFTVWVTDDYDEDGYSLYELGGADCNDLLHGNQIGSSCVRSGYTGSEYDSRCDCSGGRKISRRSSGGGGGYISMDDTESKYFYVLSAGIKYKYEFKKHTIPVRSYTLQPMVTLDHVKITFEPIKDELENSYGSFKVTMQNIEEEDVKSLKIIYRVNRSWREEYDDVVLFRKADAGDNWSELPCRYLEKDDTYYYFEADSPSFSRFSIVGKIDKPIEIQVVQPRETEDEELNDTLDIPDNQTLNITPTNFTYDNTTSATDEGDNLFPSIFFVLMVCLPIILVYMARRERFLEMEDRILLRLKQGHYEHHIVADLENEGWKSHHIKKHTERAKYRHKIYQVEEYIKNRYAMGHDQADIHRDLVACGWHETHARRLTEKLKLKDLPKLEDIRQR